MPKEKNIEHPQRLFIVGSPQCDLAGLVKQLTGNAPTSDPDGSVAGAIHSWSIKTDYYSAEVPLWIDEIHDLNQWEVDFSRPEAKEVVQALGGWICCFPKPAVEANATQSCEDLIHAVSRVIEQACGHAWDGIKLAVAVKKTGSIGPSARISTEQWDGLCMDVGFEYVDAEATGKNEFGEQLGIERIKEAVEANEWEETADDGEDGKIGNFDDEQAEMNAELWGLKASLLDQEAEKDGGSLESTELGLQVDDLQELMTQAMYIKEASSDLPLEERKRYAAKAIDQLMKDHGI